MRAEPSPLSEDLAEILARTSDLWEALRGARLFMTGATGFFGCWLLESLFHADRELDLGIRATVLTRDEARFRAAHPRLSAFPGLAFLRGDIRSVEFPVGKFTHVVHAAAEASFRLDREQPLLMREVIVEGARRTLGFAHRCGAKHYLLVSSGAVYGRQGPEVASVSEDYLLDPRLTEPVSAYAEGKREAEKLCMSAQGPVEAKIARCFAFVGPHLPFDAHFAVGNFIRDALRGGPIEVHGDGTPLRSYLYAADLAIWLWTILIKGAARRPYNVGSERSVSIADLARTVAAVVAPAAEVRVARAPEPGTVPERYIPCTQRARLELGLSETIDLEEAIRRTAVWARQKRARN